MAGPTLCAVVFSGALNGVIAATTPTGTRMVNASRCSLPGVAATGISWPAMRTASSADSRSVATARVSSVAASAGVNPVSATYSARISSRRSSSSRAASARMACRRAGGSGRCAAATAPVTARPTSAGAGLGDGRDLLLGVLVQHRELGPARLPLPVDEQAGGAGQQPCHLRRHVRQLPLDGDIRLPYCPALCNGLLNTQYHASLARGSAEEVA